MARHDAPQPDVVQGRHTLTIREVERLLAGAGVQRSHRHVLRLCQSGLFDAVKIGGGPSGEEWYVAPDSVPKAIGDLQQIDARRARRAATQPAVSQDLVGDISRQIADDAARHVRIQPDASPTDFRDDSDMPRNDMARHVTTELDIYEHPYVKRLEDRVERLEAKYEAQVRRTEEIQIKSQEKLLELQRMTAVGQSQTLAEFMLKAKDWMLGSSSEAESREAPHPQSP
jgi:hypothetical protein